MVVTWSRRGASGVVISALGSVPEGSGMVAGFGSPVAISLITGTSEEGTALLTTESGSDAGLGSIVASSTMGVPGLKVEVSKLGMLKSSKSGMVWVSRGSEAVCREASKYGAGAFCLRSCFV